MKNEDKKELIKYRLERAKKTFEEIDILIKNELWNTAINRLYYACYYAVIALLSNKDIYPQTHAGVRQMFGMHFIKTGIIDNYLGKFFSDIFDKRQTGDYDDFIEYNKNDIVELIEPARQLIEKAESILLQK